MIKNEIPGAGRPCKISRCGVDIRHATGSAQPGTENPLSHSGCICLGNMGRLIGCIVGKRNSAYQNCTRSDVSIFEVIISSVLFVYVPLQRTISHEAHFSVGDFPLACVQCTWQPIGQFCSHCRFGNSFEFDIRLHRCWSWDRRAHSR